MPKGLRVKLCLTNLINLTIVVKHKLTMFVKHLTIIVKYWLTIFRQHLALAYCLIIKYIYIYIYIMQGKQRYDESFINNLHMQDGHQGNYVKLSYNSQVVQNIQAVQ